MDEVLQHPAFWTIEYQAADDDSHLKFAEAVMIRGLKAKSHRDWAHTEIVVDEGYVSPYRFGRMLRQMIDDNATIFRYTPQNVYFAMSNRTGKAAFYDPAKRKHIPEHIKDGEIDWFEAVDHISQT